MILRLSKSKLNDYKNCPRKFYLANFTTMGLVRPESEPSYLTDGKYLHEYFEAYNQGDGSHRDFDIYSDFIRINVKNFHGLLAQYGFKEALYAEQKIYDEELDLVGVLDSVYEKNGQFYIIDYKSGKASGTKDSKLYELYLYYWLAKRNLGIEAAYLGMFFTAYPDESFVDKFSASKLVKYQEKYAADRKDILSCKFERKQSGLCPYCQYIFVCESYKDNIVD